jgi:hypothetical protein
MAVFAVGGAFAAEVLNELNWFTFGLAAALDRLSRSAAASADLEPRVVEPQRTHQPVGWRPEIAARTGASMAVTHTGPYRKRS